MSDQLATAIVYTAEAEVEVNPHGAECVRVHPGEPCPGYPHQEG